jgi:uncharacterized protein
MFFLKSKIDNFIELLTQFEFDAPEPYFDSRLFGANPVLGLIPTEIFKYDGRVLILEKQSGSWCFLEENEYAFYSTLNGRKLDDVADSHQINKIDLEEFVARLYWLGLLRINGRRFFESDDLPESADFPPFPLFSIVLTERCNLVCHHCFARSHPSRQESMTWSIAKRIIDLIMEYPTEHLVVQFTGGEPFLEPSVIERMSIYARQRAIETGKSLTIRVQTNGTLLTPSLQQLVENLDIGVGISLDGDRAANDLTRVFPGDNSSYEAITRTISMMAKRNLDYGLICVISKANCHRFNEIMDHFFDLGLSNVKTQPVMRLGRAADRWDGLGLEPEEYLEIQRNYLHYAMHQGHPALDTNICSMLEELTNKRGKKCGVGSDFLAFNPDGAIYPCARFRNYEGLWLGNVHDLDKLYGLGRSHPVIAELSGRRVSMIAECLECAYQRFCDAKCPLDSYAHFGTVKMVHPWCVYHKGIYQELFSRLAEGPTIINTFYPDAKVYDRAFFA